MNKLHLIIFLLLINFDLLAQEIAFEILGSTKKADLFQLEGEKTSKIDSVISLDGIFQFNLTNKRKGFYRIQFDNKHWINFIYDGKDVGINTDYNNIFSLPEGRFDSLKIIKSESNKLYYRFIKLNNIYKTKTELLNVILEHFPQDYEYYEISKNKLLKTQEEYKEFVEVTSQVNPSSFIARYIKSAQLPSIDISVPIMEHLAYLKNHSLDNVDFNDSEMIYSDLFTNKSIEYLTYYRNQQLPKTLLEKEFIKAVDTILNRGKVNELVYQHITEYLIDGFTKFGFDAIINYIIDNYVLKDDLCLNTEIESSIQKRIDQTKFLILGNTVPNIILPDTSGNEIDLSNIESEKVLILFYASWCTHCQTIIPKISDIYNEQSKNEFEVLAISLDTNREEWLNFIRENSLDWINVSDLRGWNSEVAESYYIYATPTIFLVDKEERIEEKPLTIEEIRKYLIKK